MFFFNIYLEDSLRRVRYEVNKSDPSLEHSYCIKYRTNLPEEIIYADDTDFLTNSIHRKEIIEKAVEKIFPAQNLKVNRLNIQF